MSKYEDYDSASRNYDNQRFAMGSDVMAAMIQFHCGKPLKDLHVLDAGCGTGNYTKALIEYGVGQVTMLDASPGMLEKAKIKLADSIESGKVKEVVQATMPPIPFPDASFDAVMFNLVLHHLDDKGDTKFRMATETLQEAQRVLRPDGFLVISTCLPSTCLHFVWFTQFNLELSERYAKCLPSFEQFDKMFNIAKFECVQKLNTIGSFFLDEYYNLDGPLDKSWRQGSSYWKFATEEEIQVIEKKVKELKQSGELENWVRAHDHTDTTGVLTWIFCNPQ